MGVWTQLLRAAVLRAAVLRAPLLIVCGLLLLGCNNKGETIEPAARAACVGSECGSCSGCAPFERCESGQCSCETRCSDETACLDDNCGGKCECPDGHVQSATGAYVPKSECHDTCEHASWVCGDLCGADCGSCDEGESCRLGKCVCEPSCDGTRCEDGCGGYCPCAEGTVCNAAEECVAPADCHDTCASEELSCGEMCGTLCGSCEQSEACDGGTCVVAESCADCPLSMRVISRKTEGGKITEVTLAVDFRPSEQVPAPRVSDLRVQASRPVWLKDAKAGAALLQAGKSLQVFPPWNDPFRKRTDGTFQILGYSASGSKRINAGRIFTLRFSLNEWGPVQFSLVEREQTFAPPDADAAIQQSGYDDAILATRY